MNVGESLHGSWKFVDVYSCPPAWSATEKHLASLLRLKVGFNIGRELLNLGEPGFHPQWG
jgi:hypothetical protein